MHSIIISKPQQHSTSFLGHCQSKQEQPMSQIPQLFTKKYQKKHPGAFKCLNSRKKNKQKQKQSAIQKDSQNLPPSEKSREYKLVRKEVYLDDQNEQTILLNLQIKLFFYFDPNMAPLICNENYENYTNTYRCSENLQQLSNNKKEAYNSRKVIEKYVSKDNQTNISSSRKQQQKNQVKNNDLIMTIKKSSLKKEKILEKTLRNNIKNCTLQGKVDSISDIDEIKPTETSNKKRNGSCATEQLEKQQEYEDLKFNRLIELDHK